MTVAIHSFCDWYSMAATGIAFIGIGSYNELWRSSPLAVPLSVSFPSTVLLISTKSYPIKNLSVWIL